MRYDGWRKTKLKSDYPIRGERNKGRLNSAFRKKKAESTGGTGNNFAEISGGKNWGWNKGTTYFWQKGIRGRKIRGGKKEAA